jgi:capsular polysaccharide export protein
VREIFAASYLLRPRYLDLEAGEPTNLEAVTRRMIEIRCEGKGGTYPVSVEVDVGS